MPRVEFLLCLLLIPEIVIAAILIWEFFDANNFALFKKTVKVSDVPVNLAHESNKMFQVETIHTGVTLADICELCPRSFFRVKDGKGGYIRIDTAKAKGQKLEYYRTVYIKKVNAKNYELEAVDPSLL